MTQLGLFDVTATRHRGNLESMEAYKRFKPKQADQRQMVYGYVSRAGRAGITCRELATLLDVGMNQISGRFSELKASQRIVKVGVREGCAVYVAA
jgi:hypothetical protein